MSPRRQWALLAAFAAVLGLGWGNSPSGDWQSYGGGSSSAGNGNITGDANITGALSAASANLRTPGGELKFSGNTVLESDGASCYASPANDSTGSLYWYTGGAQRAVVSSTGAWTLNGNVTVTGALTAAGVVNNGNATLAGNSNITGNLVVNGNITYKGANLDWSHFAIATDAAARTGLWYVDELLGSVAVTTTNVGTGTFQYAMMNTPAGVNTLPVNITASMLAGHFGTLMCQTTALNDVCGGYVGTGAGQTLVAGSPNTTWTITFMVPPVLSDPNNRYTMHVGPVFTASTLYNGWQGWSVAYSDNLNGGNWSLYESYSAISGTASVRASSIPVTTGWHTATITVATGGFLSATMDGVSFGAPVQSGIYSSSGAIRVPTVGMAIKRDISNSTVLTGYLDRVTIAAP